MLKTNQQIKRYLTKKEFPFKFQFMKKCIALSLAFLFAINGSTFIANAINSSFNAEAYSNHWGRSDIRTYLNNSLGNIDDAGHISNKNYQIDSTKLSNNQSGYAKHFNNDEYDLIQPSTVDTNVLDVSQDTSVPYTTTDKFFLPSGNVISDQIISWGNADISDNNIYSEYILNKKDPSRIIPISYWASRRYNNNYNYDFTWLRSPYYNFTSLALDTYHANNVNNLFVDLDYCLAPLFRLNIEPISFASVASSVKLDKNNLGFGCEKISILGSDKYGVRSNESLPDYGMYLKLHDDTNKNFSVKDVNFNNNKLNISYDNAAINNYITVCAYKNDDLLNETEVLCATKKITSNGTGLDCIDVSNWDISSLDGYTLQIWMEYVPENCVMAYATTPSIWEGTIDTLLNKNSATYKNPRVFALKDDLKCSWGDMSKLSDEDYSNIVTSIYKNDDEDITTELCGINPSNQKIYLGTDSKGNPIQFWIAGREDSNRKIDETGNVMCLYQAKTVDEVRFNLDNNRYQKELTLNGLNNTYTPEDKEIIVSVDGGNGTGEITYTSSNENVANIDNSGKITIKGTGEFTITAVKAADNTYQTNSVTSQKITIQ